MRIKLLKIRTEILKQQSQNTCCPSLTIHIMKKTSVYYIPSGSRNGAENAILAPPSSGKTPYRHSNVAKSPPTIHIFLEKRHEFFHLEFSDAFDQIANQILFQLEGKSQVFTSFPENSSFMTGSLAAFKGSYDVLPRYRGASVRSIRCSRARIGGLRHSSGPWPSCQKHRSNSSRDISDITFRSGSRHRRW